jgi:hypothetical protein
MTTDPTKAPSESEGTDASPTDAMDDKPPIRAIGVAILITLALLVVIVLGSRELFRSLITAELSDKVFSRTNSELRELHAEEEQKLGRYQWVSQKDGVLRIPLARAITLTLEDYRRPRPIGVPSASAIAPERGPLVDASAAGANPTDGGATPSLAPR